MSSEAEAVSRSWYSSRSWRARAIEVQILADGQGIGVHPHERDVPCSCNQKVEIAPPGLDATLRQRILTDVNSARGR